MKISKNHILRGYLLKSFAFVFFISLIVITFSLFFLKKLFLDIEKKRLADITQRLITTGVKDHKELYLISKANNLRITIINSDGTVLFDTEKPASSMENHLNREEVANAIKKGLGFSVRESTTTGKNYIYHAVLTPEKLVFRIAKEKEEVEFFFKDYLSELVFGFISMLLALIGLIYLILQKKIENVDKIFGAILAISKNEKRGEISIKKNDFLYPLKEAIEILERNIEELNAEIKRRKNLLEMIFQNIPLPSILFGSKGQVIIYNQPFNKIFPNIKDLTELKHLLRITFDFKTQKDKQLFDTEVSGRYYVVSIIPILQMEAVLYLVCFMDVTEMRKAEVMKTEFVSNLSHELKTPITVIKGFVETLEEEIDDNKKFMLDVIKRHILRLENLVKDILVLYQLEEGKNIIIEDVMLNEIVEQALMFFEKQAREKGIRIEKRIEQELKIKGDGFLILQAVTNLLSNAIKYTEKNGYVTVSLFHDSGNTYIEIKDTGIGIPAHLRDRIFERFFVVDKSRARELGGTGLGLSIVKQIMDIHKGSVEYIENKPKGSIFKVTFPKDF